MENDSPPISNPLPPSNPPPVITPNRPSVPPRKGRGWMVVALILLVLLGVSVLVNFSQFVSRLVPGRTYSSEGGPRLDEVVLENNGARNKIAVIEAQGIITSDGTQGGFSMPEVIKAQLKRAAEDFRVKAVILKVNSPGGEVLASDEIADSIRNFQDTHHKPVVVSMGSLAASGGYYISAPCRFIVANELTITGSIGVIMESFNYRGLMDKVGLEPMVFKSGRFKDMLSGSRAPGEIPPEERKMVEDLINEVYGKFKTVVREGRTQANLMNYSEGRPLVLNWEDYADGRVLSGKEALRLGFVDKLGNFDVAVESAEKIAGIFGANLVEYRPRLDLGDLFSLLGKTETPAVKIDLGISAPKLEAGQLYFLSSTMVH